MILNFDFVAVTSRSGMQNFGEFSKTSELISKLDELRQGGKILSSDSTVFMIGYKYGRNRVPQKAGAVKLSYLAGKWAIPLNRNALSYK